MFQTGPAAKDKMSRLRFSECPCCLSNNFEYLYANRDKITIASSKDFFYGGRSFISELVGCANCGFHFIIDFCINNAIMDIHGGYSLCDHPVPLT